MTSVEDGAVVVVLATLLALRTWAVLLVIAVGTVERVQSARQRRAAA